MFRSLARIRHKSRRLFREEQKMNRLEQYQLQMDKDILRIPLDLGEWVDRQVLMTWVQAEIEALDWGNPELETYLKAHPDFRPKALLALLTSAYASGVFESEEMIFAL